MVATAGRVDTDGMRNVFDVSTPAKRFRLVALWEAVTWAALLVAMVFKWGFGYEQAVMVPGMLHGITGFCLYVLVTLVTARALRWNVKVVLLALIASVPPFGSVVFERWARRYGLMAELSLADPAPGFGAAADGAADSGRPGARV